MSKVEIPKTLRLKADLHVHTIASGHGYSTYTENMMAAKAKGLELIAITDHGPRVPEGAHPWYFYNQKMAPSKYQGMRILHGCEANIVTESEWDNGLDLPDMLLDVLDFVQVGMHALCGFDDTSKDRNTEAVLEVLANPLVDQLNHPGNGEQFPLHVDEVVAAAKKHNVIIELNNHSFDPHGSRGGSGEHEIAFARAAFEAGCAMSIGSDAHYFTEIGNFAKSLEAADAIGIPDEYFVNFSAESVLKHLEAKRPRTRIDWGPDINKLPF